MTLIRRVGSRAPLMGLTAALLALLLLPALALGADWTSLRRVSDTSGSRLDSLHQVAADQGKMHLAHPRIGPKATDDRVVYQRSTNGGRTWSKERTIFKATQSRRHVVPNLAVAAKGKVVAVAWRASGPTGSSLWVRVSRNGGRTFGARDRLATTSKDHGIGVPAVAVGNDVVAVAWTNRSSGRINIRTSRNGGRSFKSTKTLGRSKLSIDCRKTLTDGLVGIAAAGSSIHVAWSYVDKQACLASSIRMRTSTNRGASWAKQRIVTKRRSFGWPELDARGKTVMATVQSPSGGVIVARSGKNGRAWSSRLMSPPKGHGYSAADVVLLPDKKAMITFVDEVIQNDRLIRTRVVSRRSANDGKKWIAAKLVAKADDKLRMAPNIANNDKRVTIVVQSGAFDGSPRNIFATRLR